MNTPTKKILVGSRAIGAEDLTRPLPLNKSLLSSGREKRNSPMEKKAKEWDVPSSEADLALFCSKLAEDAPEAEAFLSSLKKNIGTRINRLKLLKKQLVSLREENETDLAIHEKLTISVALREIEDEKKAKKFLSSFSLTDLEQLTKKGG